MKKSALVLIVIATVTISGCAAHYTSGAVSDPYGFFSGFWHGLIFPIAFCVNLISWMFSLFDVSFLRSVEIIGRPNTGFFYYLGFFFGLSATAGSAAQT